MSILPKGYNFWLDFLLDNIPEQFMVNYQLYVAYYDSKSPEFNRPEAVGAQILREKVGPARFADFVYLIGSYKSLKREAQCPIKLMNMIYTGTHRPKGLKKNAIKKDQKKYREFCALMLQKIPVANTPSQYELKKVWDRISLLNIARRCELLRCIEQDIPFRDNVAPIIYIDTDVISDFSDLDRIKDEPDFIDENELNEYKQGVDLLYYL